MKNLWSPWRSKYIEEFKSESENSDCFLCASISQMITNSNLQKQTLIVAQSLNSFVILNKFPYNAGHILVCPKKHKSDLSELSESEYADLMGLIKKATEIMQKIYNPQGYNLGLNIGSAAGAGVPGHLHYHIVPRWSGDTNFMTSVADVKVISQEIEITFDKYFEEFSKIGL